MSLAYTIYFFVYSHCLSVIDFHLSCNGVFGKVIIKSCPLETWINHIPYKGVTQCLLLHQT